MDEYFSALKANDVKIVDGNSVVLEEQMQKVGDTRSDYNTAVLNTWSSCMTQVKQKLGYRFVLLQGTYPGSASPGGGLAVNITVRNDGWAAPFNPRSVK